MRELGATIPRGPFGSRIRAEWPMLRLLVAREGGKFMFFFL